LLIGFRCFAPATRAIDAGWCSNSSSGDTWALTGTAWGTNNGPLQVANRTGLLGVQKPGHAHPTNPYTAATEKIVADLAAIIGLPIPPVTLWDRGSALGAPQYVAVSAWAFEQPLTWGQVQQSLNAQQRAQLIQPASAIIPFEAWICAQDRQNPGNMLVTVENETVLGAWIDYAFALDHVWKGNNNAACAVGPIYPPIGAADVNVMKQTADEIAAINSHAIEQIINRIPPSYLPHGVANSIISNLILRRTAVQAMWP
jgi:hypothetical protein